MCGTWDEACQSPYVYFPNTQESFARNMRCKISLRKNEGVEVVYDPGEALKEAEHKFIDYLRCDQNARNMASVISSDSDFILLTLALGMSNVALQ